jgi:methylenetetrahydrofolate--tRNA-(uracil-5-)-methyltransferase
MIGALCSYVSRADPRLFQPMKANLGILQPLAERPRARPDRGQAYAAQSEHAMRLVLAAI